MAEQIIGFVTFNPGSGDGNQAVQVTAAAHTGRNQRTTSAKVATSDGSIEKTVTVNQKAKDEFVEIQKTFSLAKEGGAITITGKSNSTKLTFSLAPGEQPLTLVFPDTYQAAGKSTANDAAIDGDPGATAEYNFSVTISDVPANVEDNDITNTMSVQAAGGQQDSCLITQAAGDKTLSINPETITLEADGSAQTLNVTSNTQWTIKQA